MADRAQIPSNPFPAWRLKYGVTNATNDELESASESAERWGWACGALVVSGIVGEFVIAILNPSFGTFLERWGSPVCDLLIGAGVAGEIMFARIGHHRDGELRLRSNHDVVEASERARLAENEAEIASGRAAEALARSQKSELRLADAEEELANTFRELEQTQYALGATQRELRERGWS